MNKNKKKRQKFAFQSKNLRICKKNSTFAA